MTVIAQNLSNSYTGTGSVGPFSFTFPISSLAALVVYQNNVVLPVTAYTVTAVNNNYSNGGLVTLNVACPVGVSLVLQRMTPLTQASTYTDNLPTPMQQLEAGLDKLTEITQELSADIAAVAATGGGGGSTGVTQYFAAGNGLTLTGAGTLTNPFVYSIAVGFTINSFTGGASAELGQTFTNPVFNVSYSGGTTSASITNTDNISSPTILTTPFTTGTITGTFVKSVAGTTTFTLTASNGSTSMNATQRITWQQRIFGGVGAVGATAAVTASGTTAHLSTGDNLPTVQLGPEAVGQLFGPYTCSSQCVYLLLTGGSHAFVDAISGFPFAFNAPIAVTFVNAYGVSLSMYLYGSTNALTGTFQPKVVS